MAPAPWFVATSLRKEFDGSVAITDADIAVYAGEVRGIVGPNGAGKSTLMQLIAGLLVPDRGQILIDGAPVEVHTPADAIAGGIFLVPQEMRLAPHLTVTENIVLGNEPRRHGLVSTLRSRRIARAALERLRADIDPDAAVGGLTTVERRLVMVARTLARNARLIILDEPTAALAPQEADSILAAVRVLAGAGVSFLYVSHRFDDIERIADGVTGIRDARVIADLSREQVTRAALVEMVTPVERDVPAIPVVRAERGPLGATVLGVDHLVGGLVHDVSMAVARGEIVGLAGLSGSGVDELMAMIAGITRSDSGSVAVHEDRLPAGDRAAATRLGIAYVPGNRTLAVLPSHDVKANISVTSLSQLGRVGVPSARRELATVRQLMSRVQLTADANQSVSSLSGGNQQKVVFARWMGAGTTVLLLHDPTAGVDVRARAEIHQRIRELAESGAAVVLVTTDIPELADLSDRILVLDRGHLVAELPGPGVSEADILAAMVSGQVSGNASTSSAA